MSPFISVVDLHSWNMCCLLFIMPAKRWVLKADYVFKVDARHKCTLTLECYNHVMYFIVILFSCLLLPQSLVWQSLESQMLGLKDCKSIKWPFYSCLPCWGNNIPGPRECYHNAGLVFDPVWMAYRYKERNKGNFTLTALTKQFHKKSLSINSDHFIMVYILKILTDMSTVCVTLTYIMHCIWSI